MSIENGYHQKERSAPRRVEDVILQANLNFLKKQCELALRLQNEENIKMVIADALDSIDTKRPVGTVFATNLQHTIKKFVEGE